MHVALMMRGSAPELDLVGCFFMGCFLSLGAIRVSFSRSSGPIGCVFFFFQKKKTPGIAKKVEGLTGKD
jgi:hypothetical protein